MGLCDIICIIMGLSLRFFGYCKYMRILCYNWPAVSGFLGDSAWNSGRRKFVFYIQTLLNKLHFDRYPLRVVISFGARGVAAWTNKQTNRHTNILIILIR